MQNSSVVLEGTIYSLLEGKKYATLRDVLVTMNPTDIAALFEDLDEKKIPLLFRLLPKELAAEVFVEMESDFQELLIRGFSDNELKEVVDELYVDDAADLVEEMPANVVKRILRQADPEMRKMINEILHYPEDSAGSVMTTEYVSLRPTMTVEDAIKRIRRTGLDKETVYTCYVTDDSSRLIGVMTLKHLLTSDDNDLVGDIMDENVISVRVSDDQEEVAMLLQRYGFVALPVVDTDNRLVGIVTVDDALDIIEAENTEDIEKMSGITPTDKEYLKSSVWELWKARIPWLLLLMLSATFTGMILAHFEHQLAAVVGLTFFIPMLMDTGGNAGAQASGTVIRSIALGDVRFRDLFRVIWKEFRVSLLCGLALSVVCFLKVIFLDHMEMRIGIVVSLTLAATVLVAKLIGGTMPVLAKKIGLDPAVISSPIISTIVDAISLLLYFSIATRLLGL